MILSLSLITVSGMPGVFAENAVSVEKIVSVEKTSLIHALSDLEKYRYILPDHIQSSKLIGENTGNLKIGLDWISVDADIKFSQISDEIVLEVISGDFKDTKLFVTLDEIDSSTPQTRILTELSLQRSWHMGILTSFVTDDDLKSVLHTSIDGLSDYAKNPVSEHVIHEEKFCIFSLCF